MIPVAAFGAAGIVAVAAGSLGWLTRGGVAAAFLVGGAVLTGSGVQGGMLLGLFFVSGSILTRQSQRSGFVTDDAKGGGSKRDAAQVAANGFWAAASALAIPYAPVLGWSALTGALAAAQADTWATEIGARASRPPRLITTGEHVPRGTSGAVTPLGTGGGVVGAALLSFIGAAGQVPLPAAVSGLLGGVLGMLVDSLLGATVQVKKPLPSDSAIHAQARVASRRTWDRGWAWCTNDAVNFACTGTGAAIAAGLAWAWSLT